MDSTPCPFCASPTRLRYPGNDPENGPAGPTCPTHGYLYGEELRTCVACGAQYDMGDMLCGYACEIPGSPPDPIDCPQCCAREDVRADFEETKALEAMFPEQAREAERQDQEWDDCMASLDPGDGSGWKKNP